MRPTLREQRSRLRRRPSASSTPEPLSDGPSRDNEARHRAVLVAVILIAAVLLTSVLLRRCAISLMGTAGAPFAERPTVIAVIDGDTIDVRTGRTETRIRLLGIDTPETKDPRRPVECFGPEAAARTAELLPPGTIVRLEADTERRDAFGRTLAHVHREDGLFVNLSLLTEGFAEVLIIPPNGTHSREFRAAAAAARDARRGLWGACGVPGQAADPGEGSGSSIDRGVAGQ